MTLKYRRQLPEFLKELGLPLIGAEIGTAEGLFSNDLLNGGLEKLYSVDAWATIPGQKGDGGFDQAWHDKNYQDAVKRLEPHGEKSVILRGLSGAMSIHVPDNSLGLVYVDCDHSYEGCFKDLCVWMPKLVEGGVMAMHDFLARQYGVKKAVEDFTHGKYTVHLIPEDKDEDAGAYFLNK